MESDDKDTPPDTGESLRKSLARKVKDLAWDVTQYLEGDDAAVAALYARRS